MGKTKFIKLPISKKHKGQNLTCVNKNGNIAVGLIYQSRLDYSFTCITQIMDSKSYMYDVTDILLEVPDREDEMREMLEEARTVIARMKRSMLVHPDHEEGSEFDDLTTSAQEMENKITEYLTN